MPKGRRRKGGRPRKDGARKDGALIRRAPVRDLGPPEVRRLRAILNPGQPGLPADPLAALFARSFIDEKSYHAGRYFSVLMAIARRGWDLHDGSVARLYARMVTGIVGEERSTAPTAALRMVTTTSAADHARDTLARMRAELCRPGEDGAVLAAAMAICVDSAWAPWLKRLVVGCGPGAGGDPQAGDYRHLSDLKEDLHRLTELQGLCRYDLLPVRAEAAE
jgi:hypothetical protein